METSRYSFRICLIVALLFVFVQAAPATPPVNPNGVAASVEWPAFLARHDLLWDRVPNRWEVAPFSGNGNVGFLFYQGEREAKNVISIYAGRHDHYDHRLPYDGNQMLWIYRSRLPLGRFQLTSKGDIRSADLCLSLFNAELTGTITTSRGSYRIHGLTHAEQDVLYFETDAQLDRSIRREPRPECSRPLERQRRDRRLLPTGHDRL